MTVRAVVFDLDGVIRHWTGDGARAGEALAGLPEGAIEAVAYAVPEFAMTQVGTATARDWADAIGRALVARYGPGADRAVDPYLDHQGTLDSDMVEVVAAVRRLVPVALLSNATDQLHDHLRHHGLTESFDLVLCSYDLRMAKPDPRIFTHAAAALGVPAADCFFTDDRPENVDGARAAGMRAEVFTGRGDLLSTLRRLGLPIG